MRFPSIADVSAELRRINKQPSADDGDDGGVDVRLQVMPDSTWTVNWGSSDYDQDHRGYWGSSSVPGDNRRFDSKDIARDLIEQAREQKATGGDGDDEVFEQPRASVSVNREALMASRAKRGAKRKTADFEDIDEVLGEMAKELDIDSSQLDIGPNSALESFNVGDIYEISIKNERHGSSWSVMLNEEQFRDLAIAIVKQDLEEDPTTFNASFIEQHIDKERLAQDLRSDVESERYDYFSGLRDSRFWKEAEGLGMDIPEEDEDGDLPEPSGDDYQKAAELASEELLRDPMAYLEDIYDAEEARTKAIDIAGIDVDAAAEDAVDTDGPAHFVARYDSEYHTTPSGFVYWRDN